MKRIGWVKLLSFWDFAYFQVRTVCFREGNPSEHLTKASKHAWKTITFQDFVLVPFSQVLCFLKCLFGGQLCYKVVSVFSVSKCLF